MPIAATIEKIRNRAWLSPGSFLVFMITLGVITILPLGYHLAFAVLEWAEMLIGTLLSVVVVLATVWKIGIAPSRKHFLLASAGLALWVAFWVVAIFAHHPNG